MSRSISISYRDARTGQSTSIEVRPPYFLLGSQRSSMAFWSLQRIKGAGVVRLAELGVTDPVNFIGWEEVGILGREIAALGENLASFPYHAESKAAWLSHLTYCYHLLRETAPADSIPEFCIG